MNIMLRLSMMFSFLLSPLSSLLSPLSSLLFPLSSFLFPLSSKKSRSPSGSGFFI